eukprot:scaffold22691_cov70-Attheya_sp.AAC.2
MVPGITVHFFILCGVISIKIRRGALIVLDLVANRLAFSKGVECNTPYQYMWGLPAPCTYWLVWSVNEQRRTQGIFQSSQ